MHYKYTKHFYRWLFLFILFLTTPYRYTEANDNFLTRLLQTTDAPVSTTTSDPTAPPPVTPSPTSAPPPTDAPVEPTEAPVATTEAPVVTTEAPVVTTEAPVEPTEAPVAPTDAPVAPTEAPVAPTDAPVAPTGAPVEPTDAPVVAMTDSPTPQPTATPTPQPTGPVPTEAPVEAPTTASPTATPTPQPTGAPNPSPTESPTQAPTPTPTRTPTGSPTPAPVAPTMAPVTRAPASTPTTAAPTNSPTPSPTKSPTGTPTATPTPIPTTASPTPVPTTSAPVNVPTTSAPITDAPVTPSPVTPAPVSTPAPVEATVTPSPVRAPDTPSPVEATDTPAPVEAPGTPAPSPSPREVPVLDSSSPTTMDSAAPTVSLRQPLLFIDLTMTLTGIGPMSEETVRVWEVTTRDYVTEFYELNPNLGVSDVTAIFDIRSQNPPFQGRRRLGDRRLQQSLVITFDESITFRSQDPNLQAATVVEQPFATDARRMVFVQTLRNSEDPSFRTLQAASAVTTVQSSSSNSFPLGAIIGIACGGALLLLVAIGAFYMCNRNKKKGFALNDAPPTSVAAGGRGDEVSALDNPSKIGGTTAGESIVGYGDQSVATVDYDYSKAYGGAADHSVSSAGGTFGSNTHGGGQSATDAFAAGGATLGSFDDDGSFGDRGGGYRDSNMREELIDIYAPPGKLGVVIDTPDDGAPIVHAIKDSSVIADKLQVGDQLVAVDDEDVRTMTAIKVSKLISRKSANSTRKLSIIRTTVVE